MASSAVFEGYEKAREAPNVPVCPPEWPRRVCSITKSAPPFPFLSSARQEYVEYSGSITRKIGSVAALQGGEPSEWARSRPGKGRALPVLPNYLHLLTSSASRPSSACRGAEIKAGGGGERHRRGRGLGEAGVARTGAHCKERRCTTNRILTWPFFTHAQVRRMDLEARSLSAQVKTPLLAKLRDYKNELTNLKKASRESQRLSSLGAPPFRSASREKPPLTSVAPASPRPAPAGGEEGRQRGGGREERASRPGGPRRRAGEPLSSTLPPRSRRRAGRPPRCGERGHTRPVLSWVGRCLRAQESELS